MSAKSENIVQNINGKIFITDNGRRIAEEDAHRDLLWATKAARELVRKGGNDSSIVKWAWPSRPAVGRLAKNQRKYGVEF